MSSTKKTTTNKAAPPKTTPKPKKAAAPTAVVYCGPTIKNGPHQFTVYNNGIPDDVRAIVNKVPLAGNLIVPVEEFARIKAELRDSDSPAGMIYHKVFKSLQGGKS